MNTDIRTLMHHCLSQDKSLRTAAEKYIEQQQKNPEFVLSLPSYFKDPDMGLKKYSSILFKNSVIREWNSDSFVSLKQTIKTNLFDLILESDTSIQNDLFSVLEHIVANESYETWAPLPQQAEFLVDTHPIVAFKFYILVVNLDAMFYKNAAETMFLPLSEKMLAALKSDNAELVCVVAKLIAKLYDGFGNYPMFLQGEIIVNYLRSGVDIISMRAPQMMKARKWMIKYTQVIMKRALQTSQAGTEFSMRLLEESTFTTVYDLIYACLLRGEEDNAVKLECVSYINTILKSAKTYRGLFEAKIEYLVFNFIFPLFKFNDDDEDIFENNAVEFIRERYNTYLTDLRSYASNLFCDILRLSKGKPLEAKISERMVSISEKYKQNSNEENAREKFGIVELFVSFVYSADEAKEQFVVNYLIPDLFSSFRFLRSSALFALQHFEIKNISQDALTAAFQGIVGHFDDENQILQTDAVLASTFILSHEDIQTKLVPMLPGLLSRIIALQQIHEIDALAELLDTLIQTFSDDICGFAVELCRSQIHLAIHSLQFGEEKMMLIMNILSTISTLTLSLEKHTGLINDIYAQLHPLLDIVITTRVYDILPETIQLLSDVILALKTVDQSRLQLFNRVLEIDQDELVACADEMVCLIDNFLTFTRSNEHTVQILGYVKALCMDSDVFFDDDYEHGCKILESVIINTTAEEYVTYILDIIMYNYKNIDTESTSIIYYLLITMQCFISSFDAALRHLKNQHVAEKFINDLYVNRKRFTRVSDKKTMIMFIAVLFTKGNFVGSFDYKRINKVLLFALTTLKAAELRRQALKDNTDYNGDDDDDEEEEEEEELFEDILVESVLHTVDVRTFLNQSLQTIGPHGEQCIKIMTDKQKGTLQSELNTQ